MAATMAITADQLSALSLIGDLRPADIVALRSFIQDRRSSAAPDAGLTGYEDEVLAFAQQAAPEPLLHREGSKKKFTDTSHSQLVRQG